MLLGFGSKVGAASRDQGEKLKDFPERISQDAKTKLRNTTYSWKPTLKNHLKRPTSQSFQKRL